MMRIPQFAYAILMLCAAAGIIFFFFHEPAAPEISYDPSNLLHNRDYWAAELKDKGGAAYDSFKEKNAAAPNPDTQHLGAHLFGELMFEELGAGGVTVCDASFNFGCYHGFFTKAVAGAGLSSVANLNTACKTDPKRTSACQHGLGHGVLEFVGHQDLIKALDVCAREVPENPDTGCASGVFMEYNVPFTISDDGVPLFTPRAMGEDPYDPCPSLAAGYQGACYMNLPQWWKQTLDDDFPKMIALCEAVADEGLRLACVTGVGTIAGPSHEYDVERTRGICSLFSVQMERDLCLRIAASSFSSNVSDTDGGEALCAYITDSNMRSICP